MFRVARNGGQALVTPRNCFLLRSGIRGVTMLRPRLHAIPERLTKRVTAGTGPRYVEATQGRSNVTWFRPPVTRAEVQGTASACPPRPPPQSGGAELKQNVN